MMDILHILEHIWKNVRLLAINQVLTLQGFILLINTLQTRLHIVVIIAMA